MKTSTFFLLHTFSASSLFQTSIRLDNTMRPDRCIVKSVTYVDAGVTTPLLLKTDLVGSSQGILCPVGEGTIQIELTHQLNGTFSSNNAYEFKLTEVSGILYSGNGDLIVVMEFQQD